jgi:cell division protein FtsZ
MSKKQRKVKHRSHSGGASHRGAPSPKSDRGLTKIVVVGAGGGGSNAVTRMMMGDRPRGVEFIAVNTDAQDLDYASAHRKLYIGRALTRGLGAGMNPEIGKQAAEENRSEIGEAIEGADVVFITAGFGGGTGTGAAPVIAEIAKEKGILTIAVVTKPFAFEGAQRMAIAQEGLGRLKEKVDALVVIPNDRIFTIIDKDTSVMKAFAFIDEILKQGVQAIAELVNTPGIVNVDFADIKTILRESGQTLIGIGTATGEDRSIKAVQNAVNSPLLEVSMEGAKGVLFSIAGSRDLKMSEINDIAKAISGNLDANAKVIFGAYYDRSLKDKAVKVTVIATGFNGMFADRRGLPTLFMTGEPKKTEPKMTNVTPSSETVDFGEGGDKEKPFKTPPGKPETGEAWEIPTFLRKKKR